MTMKRGRKTNSNNGDDEEEEVFAGNGEASNVTQQFPLSTWSAGNRTYPWMVKRGRASGQSNSLSSGSSCIMGGPSSIRHFSLNAPLPIEEASYRRVAKVLSHKKRWLFEANFSQRQTEERKAAIRKAEECKEQLRKAREKEALAAEDVKRAKTELQMTKVEIEKEKEAFEFKLEEMKKQHDKKLAEKIVGPEEELKRINEEIAELRREMEEADKKRKAREANDLDQEGSDGKSIMSTAKGSSEHSGTPKSTERQTSACPSELKDESLFTEQVDSKKREPKPQAAVKEGQSSANNGSAETGQKPRLSSEVKAENLKKVKSDMDDLNQTKSQMIWLLKQVITAENKRKIAAKAKQKAKGIEKEKLDSDSKKPAAQGDKK